MLLIAGIQAGCFTLIKTGLDFAPPLLFGGLRATIGGSALLAFAAVTHRPILPTRSTWFEVVLLALVATTITFGAMFLSPGRTEAGIASSLGNLQPFITLVLAYWLFSEPLSAGKAAAVILGVTGVTLISYPTLSNSNALGISGAALALAVSFGSSAGNALVKRMKPGDLLLAITGWQLTIGGLALIVLAVVAGEEPTVEWSVEFLGLLVFLALIGTALITALWYQFVQEEQMGRLATFFYLVPVFGLAIAVLVFDEAVGEITLGGAFIVLLAVAVMAHEPSARGT